MKLTFSKKLQRLAAQKDQSALVNAADYEFGGDDQPPILGIEAGLKLATIINNSFYCEKIKVFLIKFPDYEKDDGVAIFLGTEDEVTTLLKSLPNKD